MWAYARVCVFVCVYECIYMYVCVGLVNSGCFT